MRRLGQLILLVALLAAAPMARGQGNVLSDPVCVGAELCVEPTACVDEVLCQSTTCSPAAECGASFGFEGEECNARPPIDGQTCQTSAELGFVSDGARVGVGGQDVEPFVPGMGAVVRFVASDGNVSLQHLPNAWNSFLVEVAFVYLGSDAGTTSLQLYTSEIDTTNGNRVNQYAVDVRSGPSGGSSTEVASVGMYTLDGMPEACYVRAAGNGVSCSDLPLP